MKSHEKQKFRAFPRKYRPLCGVGNISGITYYSSIPLIGFICLIVFAVSDSNIVLGASPALTSASLYL